MSSYTVRQVVRGEMELNWSATPWFDLSDYVTVDDIPTPSTSPFVLVEFIGGQDEMITIAGTGGEAGYREDGIIYFHYVIPTGFPYMVQMPTMEQLRNLFKNKRFGDVVIENIDPFTDQAGASIQIDGPFHGFSSTCYYYTDSYVL